MNESDALAQVARLFAAFPSKLHTADTAKAYAEQLVSRRSPEALRDAVDNLIRGERWLPPVSMLLEEYNRQASKYAPKQLSEPEPTEEQRLENARKWKAVLEHLRQGEGHTIGIEDCEHPECKWATREAAGVER